MEIVIAAREMCTNVREEKSEQQIKGSKEKKKEMEGEKGKEEECFVFYVSHVFFFTAEVTASSIQRLLLSRR